MLKKTVLGLLALLTITGFACKSEKPGIDKKSVAYVEQRVNEIFAGYPAFVEKFKKMELPSYDCYESYDSLYCSEGYLELYRKCREADGQSEEDFEEYDHWLNSMDIDEKMDFKLIEVEIDKKYSNLAVAEYEIGGFTMRVSLVFERDDWFVDDFLHVQEAGAESDRFLRQSFIASVKGAGRIDFIGNWMNKDESEDATPFIVEIEEENGLPVVDDWGIYGSTEFADATTVLDGNVLHVESADKSAGVPWMKADISPEGSELKMTYEMDWRGNGQVERGQCLLKKVAFD